MLDLHGIGVRYDDTIAVDGLDLHVGDGELVSVLGPSGCGKSTLLQAVAGLVPLSTGRVEWNGEDLAGTPTHRRDFGLMFQDHALFPHRNVLANVAFGLRMRKLPPADTEARSLEALRLVGMSAAGNRNVHELSGGEQQRVALARALAPRPRLLMLDEPLGSLDRLLRERLVVELRELFEELGTSVLAVTHDHDEAFALGDRVVILRDGRVEEQGPAPLLWRRPTTEFSARFLGFVNVVDGTVAAGVARCAWGSVGAPDVEDGAVLVAARAEGLVIDPEGPIRGVVEHRTFRRHHFLVRVRLDGGTTVEVAFDPVRLPDLGSPVRLALDPDAAIVVTPRI